MCCNLSVWVIFDKIPWTPLSSKVSLQTLAWLWGHTSAHFCQHWIFSWQRRQGFLPWQKTSCVFHLALHDSLQLVNRLGSAKSGAELYHHSAAALTQERRGDQAITIEGTTLAQLRTYASKLPQKNPHFLRIQHLCHLIHVGCWCPCICTSLEMCMGTGQLSSGPITICWFSKLGKSTSYNAGECVIWKRRSKWRVCHAATSAKKYMLYIVGILENVCQLGWGH